MALTAEEQELFDLAERALPSWFRADARVAEFLGLAAKAVGASRAQSKFWFEQAAILTAVGPTGLQPDWLNQHALDRGTSRQDGETDAALRERLRNIPDSITRSQLLNAITEIVSEAGEPTSGIAMVELARDQGHFGKQSPLASVGGTFSGPVGSTMTFTPTTLPWAAPPFLTAPINPNGRILNQKITFVGSNSAGNDGTFPTTGLTGNGVEYTNASGVGEVDPLTTWEVDRFDKDDEVVTESRDDFYFGRGYRIGRKGKGVIIAILPFGCTEGTRKSVSEMLRQKKGAGVIQIVECRANP